MKGKKTGGRQKGTPNKVTVMSKVAIADILTDYNESGLMQSDFMLLKPIERITIAEKLMQYVVPKMQSVAMDVNSEQTKTIEDRLIELSTLPQEKK